MTVAILCRVRRVILKNFEQAFRDEGIPIKRNRSQTFVKMEVAVAVLSIDGSGNVSWEGT